MKVPNSLRSFKGSSRQKRTSTQKLRKKFISLSRRSSSRESSSKEHGSELTKDSSRRNSWKYRRRSCFQQKIHLERNRIWEASEEKEVPQYEFKVRSGYEEFASKKGSPIRRKKQRRLKKFLFYVFDWDPESLPRKPRKSALARGVSRRERLRRSDCIAIHFDCICNVL